MLYFPRRFTLQYKITVAFFVLSISPFLLGGGIILYQGYEFNLETALDLNHSIAGNLIEKVQDYLDRRKETVSFGLLRHEIFNLDSETLDFLLRSAVRNPAHLSISIIDRTGREVGKVSRFDVVAPSDYKDISDSDLFRAINSGKEYVSQVFIESEGGRFPGEPLMEVGFPIQKGGSGQVIGGVSAVLNLKRIQADFIADAKIGRTGIAYIVDKQGYIVAHPDITEVLKRSSIAEREDIKRVLEDVSVAAEFSGVRRGSAGDRLLVTSNYVPSLGLVFVAERHVSEILDPVYKLAYTAGIIFLMILLGILLFGTLVARDIVRPIRVLSEGVRQIGAGNFSYTVDIHTKDEVEDLAGEFNKMGKNLLRAREKEKEIARIKSEFLAIAAHQLRTPLSILKWSLATLMSGDNGRLLNPQRNTLEKGYIANQRMIDLVDEIMNVVQIEEGRFAYKMKRTQLEDMVGQVVKDVKVIAGHKKIKIFYDAPIKPLGAVNMDEDKLRLALANLLDNALQYTRPGGKVSVTINEEPKAQELIVAVRDNGIGIPEEQSQRIFEKFFRAKNAMQLYPNGSGLGLFIAKSVIEDHGGSLIIKSEENKGTEALFTIPLASRKA